MKNHLLLILSILGIFQCTNYSTSKQKTVPPHLVALAQPSSSTSLGTLTAIPSGYLLLVRAGNPEIFFEGYRLYVGNTESEARNPADLTKGTDCADTKMIPNQPIEYSIEISGNAGGLAPVNPGENTNRLCKFQLSLSTGQYITLRSKLRSQTMTGTSYSLSEPSNSLIVP